MFWIYFARLYLLLCDCWSLIIIYTWRYICWALSSCRCYCWCCWYFFDWDFAWTNVAFLLFLFEMLFVGLVFGKVQSWYLLKKLLFVWFLGLLVGVIGVFGTSSSGYSHYICQCDYYFHVNSLCCCLHVVFGHL